MNEPIKTTVSKEKMDYVVLLITYSKVMCFLYSCLPH